MKNPKIFPILVVMVAITLVSYIAVFKIDWNSMSGSDQLASSDSQNREILSYIPADSIFFFGGLHPASFQDAVDILTPQANWTKKIDWEKAISNAQMDSASPAEKMMTGLYIGYMNTLQDIQSAAKTLGTGDMVDSVFYTVGAIPVMRIKLEDPAAFNAFIDSIEQKTKVTANEETLGDINFRSYNFDTDESADKSDVKLIIAEHNKYALITFATPLEDEQARGKIMGSSKPENSLANQSTLVDLKNKYQFHPAYLGYINHREVMNGLTSTDGNDFGRMIDVLLNLAASKQNQASEQPQDVTPDAERQAPLAKVRSPECRTELMAVADNWPQTVFGYTKMDLKSQPKKFAAKGVIESNDTTFLQEFGKVRGYIPSTVSSIDNKPIFGVGLGINVDALLPFMNSFIQSITQKEYKCAMLAEMKQSLAASNPAMALGMMSGMAAGVQGISVAILDLEGSINVSEQQPMPDIKSIDAIISISSSNPQSLLMLASNFMQGMPPIQLPPDGTAIDLPLPIPLPFNESPKLALKGNHIVAYMGKKGELAANKLANEPLNANGIFTMAIDLGKYMNFVNSSMEGVQKTANEKDANQADLEILKSLENMNGQFVESLDVSKDGLELNVDMTM